MNGDLSIAAQAMPLNLAPSPRSASSGPTQPSTRDIVTRTPVGAATPIFVAAVGEHEEAARLKSLLTDPEVQISTHLDDATGRFVLQVQSLATGEVVEQIPSEELLRLYASMRESLVDECA
jgi:septal ring-binding cell division protein DamX